MADLKPRNLEAIRSGTATPAQMYECISDLVAAQNNVAQQTNSAPIGQNTPPPSHSALSVKGGAGIFDIAVTDNNPKYRGAENFFEYSMDGQEWHTRSMGPSRNWRGSLGQGPFQFRSYSAHPTTGASDHTYCDGMVSGAGSAEPAMQASQGSGTSNVPGNGFGAVPFTGDRRPVR